MNLGSSREDFKRTAEECREEKLAGLDIEFDPTGRITLVAIASDQSASSLAWDEGRAEINDLISAGTAVVGHALTTVDAPRVSKALGIEILLEKQHDTYIWHYLLNADFCKVKETKDGTESRGTGHMDLWTMASIYTGWNQWKACRGNGHCSGPCPICDPVGYNTMDAVVPRDALPALERDARAKGVPRSTYDHVARVSLVCEKMQGKGVRVDLGWLEQLRARLEREKEELFLKHEAPRVGQKGQILKTTTPYWTAEEDPVPFNPASGLQVKAYFKSHGVYLQNTDKDAVKKALGKVEKRKDLDTDVEKWLKRLLDWKDAGKGLDPWFGEKYVDALGYIHPRFNACGTSTGRLASSNPNFQNIPKHGGWAKDIRRAIIPRSKDYRIVRADSKQLELRMVLWLAGVHEDYGDDAFAWLVRKAPDLFEALERTTSVDMYKLSSLHESGVKKGHRNGAKMVSHATDYLAGFKVLYGTDLSSVSTVRAVRAGALRVYEDWEYAGGVVAFTGVKLAENLFGDASFASRKAVLELQDAYYERFPEIKAWHRSVTAQAETGSIRSPYGRFLALRGGPEDNAKDAAAFLGQGGGADYVRRGMIALDNAGYTPLINIHDENAIEVPKTLTDDECHEIMQLMAIEQPGMGGFKCPVDTVAGENYADCSPLKLSAKVSFS